MINSFKNYLVEEERTIYFTFGRMNPPTIGHEKLMNALSSKSGKNPYRIYISQSQDPKKNPLQFTDKVKATRKMFPRHARQIMADKKLKNALEISSKLYDEGFKRIVMVVGSDRVNEFEALLKKYNGQKGRHGFYNFERINVMSAGDRDPDAEGATGMSASKMRKAASDDDFTAFSQGLPKNVSNADAKNIFNAVRKGMGLKEQKEFKNHVQLEPVSDIRESYIGGELFNEGDEVVIKENGIVGKIKHLGSNYVIVESKGETWRKWLTAVEKVDPSVDLRYDIAPHSLNKLTEETQVDDEEEFDLEDYTADFSVEKQGIMTVSLMDLTEAKDERKKESPQDPDIKDRPGTQPKAYYSGLKSKSTKKARDRHFKKYSKYDDDNPAAYKPAPGDKTAKTKPSKHTKRFKQMFGDD